MELEHCPLMRAPQCSFDRQYARRRILIGKEADPLCTACHQKWKTDEPVVEPDGGYRYE